MNEFYQSHHLQKQFSNYGAYLMDYDGLSKVKENEILDKDDLMHLLIVLQRYPSLVRNREDVEQKLADCALAYAIELASQNREEYIYYIMMIPESRLVEDTSTMIAYNQLYSSIKW